MKEHLMAFLTEFPKDAPQVSVAATILLFGMPIEKWVLVFTLGWAVIRLAMVVYDFYNKIKDRNGTSK